jgi:hypothetical protein
MPKSLAVLLLFQLKKWRENKQNGENGYFEIKAANTQKAPYP